MIGQLGIIVLSFADTMMIGRHSVDELAAASFVNNMFNLVIIFSTGFSYGLTPVIGRLAGRKEDAKAGCVLRNALAVNSMIAIVLIVVMSVLLGNIHRLGQPDELIPLMRPYFLTLLVSLVFVLPFNAFKQFADGITDTITPMCILLGGNVFNIVFNWFLIYGKAGFPEMGLLGAGIATLASRALMLLVFIVLFFSSSSYKPYLQGFTGGKFNRKDASELVRLGMPVGLQMGMETASFSLSTVMVGWLGTIALAAHQVMLTA
ncbi:MAG: MATE family efflux transporter, partial [Candidatus Cryptobacteroides sp.]